MYPETCQHIRLLRGPVPLAHLFMRTFLCEGDRAVDATCGNGGDTLLLAEMVGATGRVWAFDIQPAALLQTARRLADAGLAERVELIGAGHETLGRHVSGDISMVVFNLGYLPGGDRGITTRAETTVTALEGALETLKPGGVLAVTVYPGHQEGRQEQLALDEWASRLEEPRFHSWRMAQTNAAPLAPYFMLIQKAC